METKQKELLLEALFDATKNRRPIRLSNLEGGYLMALIQDDLWNGINEAESEKGV